MSDEQGNQTDVDLAGDTIGTPLPQHIVGFPEFEEQFNGVIVNDKFCHSRHLQLTLSWWRCPIERRTTILPNGMYPPLEQFKQGGTYAQTDVAGEPPNASATERTHTLGSRLPDYSAPIDSYTNPTTAAKGGI